MSRAMSKAVRTPKRSVETTTSTILCNTRGSKTTLDLKGSFHSTYGTIRFMQADAVDADSFGLKRRDDALMVTLIMIDRERRGQGHGSAMLQSFLDQAKHWGYKWILLSAWPLNERGFGLTAEQTAAFQVKVNRIRNFYQRFGFTVVEDQYLRLKLK